MRRGKWMVWLLLGCVGVSLLVMFALMDPQPYYQGRSLSTWLNLYYGANQHFPTDPGPAQALRQMGPRSLPYLVAWLPYERPAWKDRVLSTLNSVPPPLHRVSTNFAHKVRVEWQRRESGYRMAIWGFGVLGPAARPAAAQLGRLALNRTGAVADRAARALMDMGTNAEPAVPLLLSALRGGRQPVAARAAWLLGALESASPVSVPRLITSLGDPNPAVRVLAMRALGKLGDAAGPAIPALLEASRDAQTGAEARTNLLQIPSFAMRELLDQLQSGSFQDQQRAINGLGEFGPRGRRAVPVLLEAARQQPSVAFYITNALRKLAPELVPEAAPSLTGAATFTDARGTRTIVYQGGQRFEAVAFTHPAWTNPGAWLTNAVPRRPREP